jgi:membrane-bound lytic murein transglycosylase B
VLTQPASANYRDHAKAQAFIARMVSEHGFDRQSLLALFAQAQKQPTILAAIARPAEKTKSWAEYRPIFLTDSRIANGVTFWQANAKALARAEQVFAVPAEYIVAIIGVETSYGRITGRYRVLDALSTLAFDYPPRSEFFTRELEQYLLLTREHQQDPLAHKGSYAGAMGYGQFMPSSYRHYAVDFSGDNLPDIWHNEADVIGSVAHYFARHGWQKGGHVAVRARAEAPLDTALVYNKVAPPARTVAALIQAGLTPIAEVDPTALALPLKLDGALGQEYWLGFNNFYVITRYNRSHLYAMAVQQLAQKIYRAYPTQTTQGAHRE